MVRSAPRATSPKASLHFGGAGWRCTSGLAGVPISIDVDLSQLHWQLDFTVRPASIHFLVAGSPKITGTLTLKTHDECHITLPLHIVIPIAGTPLVVKISPRLELSNDGSTTAQLAWTPRLAFGFDRGPGISQNIHAFNVGKVAPLIRASNQTSLFFGPEADLTLGGRVGVSAAFGPKFSLATNATATELCADGDVALAIDAKARADLFVAKWSFDLFTITIAHHPLYHDCGPKPNTGGGGSGNGSGGPGTGGAQPAADVPCTGFPPNPVTYGAISDLWGA